MSFIRIIILSLLVINFNIVNAVNNNQTKIDSLENILKKTKGEKSIPLLWKLSEDYLLTDVNKSLTYAGKSLELSTQYENEYSLAISQIHIADAYYEMSRYLPAIEFYEKALDYFYDQRTSDYKIYIYTKLGDSERSLNNFNNALFYYQKPLNLYLAEKNNRISEAYNNIGIIHKLLGQYNEAFNYHQKALEASNLALDQKEIANTLKYIGSLYWTSSKYDSSIYYNEKALEIYRENSDLDGEATILANIGIVYKDIGEYTKALDYNAKALDIRTESSNRNQIADSYNNIGSIYLSINDYQNALDFYLSSLKIRENINDILGIAQSQNNIALVYRRQSNYQEALEYFNKSLNNYKKIGNSSFIAGSINQIGTINKILNKYDLALENYLKALRIWQDKGEQDKVASILTNIGLIYEDISNYTKALESFSKSLKIKRSLGNNKEIAYSLHIIGNAYLKLGNFSEALNYYTESLNLRKEVGDKVSIANSLKSIGNLYLEMSDYDNSLKFLNDALELRKETGDIKGESDILNDIGNYYSTVNNNDKALEYFNRTIEICKKTGDQSLTAVCNKKIGVILLNKGFENEGLNNINNSLRIGQAINNLEIIKNSYFELFKYYNKLGVKDIALENYMNYTIFKDSITSKLNSQRLVEIQMNFELEESYNQISRIEDEITELTIEKKFRELELKKQKNVRNLLFVIVLITLISGILIFNQYLSKRITNVLLKEKINEADKSNKLLKESEEDLKILNATKDKFFSIIAHDLRNPFNALHGLTKYLLENFMDFSENEIKESLELVYNSADDLLELLENLLHWSRTQRGNIEFSPIEVNLSEIIINIFNLLKMNADKKEINLINEIPSDNIIIADYDMLTIILRNLISNAIKFSNKNNFIRISKKDSEEYTEISVMDNGVGISAKNIKKLFRIDVHHSTSGTSAEQGSGLGLILCREFVEKHNGKIWVSSTINKGSTFKFTIPKNNKNG
ncbi:MAG: tetratricopeptide repeat-containing sensor histidine kinase [Bacteroidales bacterium]|nr:tetratricopeptide repeat-containing sensor histidine kinase [Bacteroidales bacterium]